MFDYLRDGMTVLFQGDSITDCARTTTDPDGMGQGYPLKVSEIFKALYPDRKVRFVNRGVTNDKCENLLNRYDRDILEVHPDVLSILIGINDVGSRYVKNDPRSPERFEREYRTLLDKIRADLPDCRLILMQPFLMHTLPEQWAWHEDLNEKATIVARLAYEYGAVYIPLQGVFDQEICRGTAPALLSADGVHPTSLGHNCIAREYIRALDFLK